MKKLEQLDLIETIKSMISNIEYLLNNKTILYKIANQGYNKVKEFSWSCNTKKLENILVSLK